MNRFVNDEGDWNWQLLHFVLPLNVCEKIAGISPPLVSASSDSVLWSVSHDGNFSLHSSYHSLANHSELQDDRLFRLIWHWKGLDRIKVFLWQVAIGALPTNLFHFNRHIANNANCGRCNLDVHESLIHVLRDCLSLGDFWHRLVKPEDSPNFFTASIHHWLSSNLRNGHIHAGLDWPQVFGSALHFLWQARNEELFESVTLNPDKLFSKFWAVFHDNLMTLDFTGSQLPHHNRSLQFITWVHPLEGWTKINSDGSVLNASKTSCGGLLRNFVGKYMGGYSVNLFVQ